MTSRTLVLRAIIVLGLGYFGLFTQAMAAALKKNEGIGPIALGLRFLDATQIKEDREILLKMWEWAGDWPQVVYVDLEAGPQIPDVNPFVAASVFPALGLVTDETAPALGLVPRDVRRARNIRERALALMERFKSPAWRSDAGSYGFWPLARNGAQPEPCPALALAAQVVAGFDPLRGDRGPVNICFLLRRGYVPSDADVTANVLAARLDAARLDGAQPLPAGLEELFADWRDLGTEPYRVSHEWMAHPTGAFLTWIPRRTGVTPQDVDLVVNANVLLFLGRYGRLDTPGVAEAVALINRATGQGRHLRITDVSQYYPDSLIFHYVVGRAYDQGGVHDLQPAIDVLVAEIEQEAIARDEGQFYWDRGHPTLNTALAVSTLVSAGASGDLVDGGVAYLRETQDPLFGNWPAAPFFLGTTSKGVTGIWESQAWNTAMALEALMRARLAGALW